MMRLVIVVLIGLTVGPAKLASACTCVVNPGRTFTIDPESKGVLATGTVKEVRILGSNRAMVTVAIVEPLRNARAGDAITLHTNLAEESCGFEFREGAGYVIQSDYLDLPSLLFPDVPVGSQIVHLCGRTTELNTPEGRKVLTEIQQAVQRLPR